MERVESSTSEEIGCPIPTGDVTTSDSISCLTVEQSERGCHEWEMEEGVFAKAYSQRSIILFGWSRKAEGLMFPLGDDRTRRGVAVTSRDRASSGRKQEGHKSKLRTVEKAALYAFGVFQEAKAFLRSDKPATVYHQI